jgi:hypothetical protein
MCRIGETRFRFTSRANMYSDSPSMMATWGGTSLSIYLKC